jgi:hypothetical protein
MMAMFLIRSFFIVFFIVGYLPVFSGQQSALSQVRAICKPFIRRAPPREEGTQAGPAPPFALIEIEIQIEIEIETRQARRKMPGVWVHRAAEVAPHDREAQLMGGYVLWAREDYPRLRI